MPDPIDARDVRLTAARLAVRFSVDKWSDEEIWAAIRELTRVIEERRTEALANDA